ncbi:hypothetical protein NVSP9465_04080 [Novosphingobium sp. CECT 9465]|nr:hypothetical protein NVSP9465_04080 [Novosphingobium sp. CECT 9465]
MTALPIKELQGTVDTFHFDHRSVEQTAQPHFPDWTTYRLQDPAERGMISIDRDILRRPIDQVITVHPFDRKDTHQQTTCKPEQQLGANNEREPAVQSARPDMEAMADGTQNQVRTPRTKLVAETFSPSARAKSAVRPIRRSYEIPM